MKKIIFTIAVMLCSVSTLLAQDLVPFEDANGNFGYKDKTGKIIVSPKYSYGGKFVNGFARVAIEEKRSKTENKETGTSSGYSSSSVLASVMANKKSYLWGFIDEKGQEVIATKYYKSGNFSEDLAVVNLDGDWGYIDKTGKQIIAFKYEEAYPFNNGKASVVQNGRSFYIDKTGKEIP